MLFDMDILKLKSQIIDALNLEEMKPEDINDDGTVVLAREIAKRIENEMEYPGQIKVNVIRETRATEYAK